MGNFRLSNFLVGQVNIVCYLELPYGRKAGERFFVVYCMCQEKTEHSVLSV